MPIDYQKYPLNWALLRQTVLNRADNKCECCGFLNGDIVYSLKVDGKTVWEKLDYGRWMMAGQPKKVKVVLTIAHLDHDEGNQEVKIDRLKAMCQLCHLRYDAPEKARRRREKKGV